MPSIDIEVDEFVWSCSKYDIKELIKVLVENEHLPKELYTKKGEVKSEMIRKTVNEIEFSDKLDLLKGKYFSISQEDELTLQTIINKYT
jgi:hypothetical protein